MGIIILKIRVENFATNKGSRILLLNCVLNFRATVLVMIIRVVFCLKIYLKFILSDKKFNCFQDNRF